jgi:ABC-type branched-subunit amino acid transport system substrate-binding protein
LASAILPTPFPEIEIGAKAAAKAINDAGGLNGHQITVVGCDTKAEPNEATKCAQQAVKDEAIAVVGAFDFKGDYMAVLERAEIPVLAPFAQAVELTSPLSYPVNGGSPTLLAGEISVLASQGARNVSFVAPAAAVEGEDLSALWAPVIDHFPGLQAELIAVPSETTDLSAIAEKASKGDALGIALQAGQFVPFIKAFNQAAPDIRLRGTDTNSLDAGTIKTLASDVEGFLAASNYMPATTEGNDAVDAFNAAIDAIDPEAPRNDFTVVGYLGVQLFAQAAEGLDDVSNVSLRESLDSGQAFDLGLTPPVSFDEPSTAMEGATRVFNTAVVYVELKDGKFLPIDGQFVDAYSGQPVE